MLINIFVVNLKKKLNFFFSTPILAFIKNYNSQPMPNAIKHTLLCVSNNILSLV